MTKEEYIALYEKHLEGRCNPFEEELLQRYEDDFKLIAPEWNEAEYGEKEAIEADLESRLKKSIRPSRKSLYKKAARYAAAAIVLIGIGTFLYVESREEPLAAVDTVKKEQEKTENDYRNDISPGSNKAVLILSDGSKISLDDIAAGSVANESGTAISKTNDGMIVYNAASAASPGAADQINTIATPRGGQYKIILPDGSQVWLNAESSIRFPASFAGSSRDVAISGEVYFEVEKDVNKPFNVSVKGPAEKEMKIQVLGTSFNISAYNDIRAVQTTLLEGSVKILNGSDKAMLKPGQQASVAANTDRIRVKKANTEASVAWKNGYFMFNNRNIREIMNEIARWYDVEVVYEGNMDDRDFGGRVSKFENVSEVLRVMQLTGIVRFKIVGRRVTVMS